MAAKVFESGQDVPLERRSLADQVHCLVSQRLHGEAEESGTRALCAKILEKRRRKWRNRHRAEKATHDQVQDAQCNASQSHQEHQQKKNLSDTALALQTELASTRREGLETVRRLRTEKWDHCLQVIRYRLQSSKELLQDYLEGEPSLPPSTTAETTTIATDGHQTIQDLQAAISQAQALKDIRKMKLQMTPMVPPLQNNRSLPDIPTIEVNQDISLTDSNNNNCTIPVALTTEVSTTSLSPATDQERLEDSISMPVSFMPSESNLRIEFLPSNTDNSTTTDTDTPSMHVGMEMVCGEGVSMVVGQTANDDVVVASSGHSKSHLLPITNNHSSPRTSDNETDLTSLTKKSKITRTPLTRKHRFSKTSSPRTRFGTRSSTSNSPATSSSLTVENGDRDLTSSQDEDELEVTDTDTDSDSQMRKMLQVLERAPYELRVPQKNSGSLQRYSFRKISLTSSGVKLRSKRKRSYTPKRKET